MKFFVGLSFNKPSGLVTNMNITSLTSLATVYNIFLFSLSGQSMTCNNLLHNRENDERGLHTDLLKSEFKCRVLISRGAADIYSQKVCQIKQ